MTQFQDELQRDLQSLQQSFSDLDSLKQSFSELDAQLIESAREMREHGIPPKADLALGIEIIRRNFDELRLRTGQLAHTLASVPLSEQLNSLNEIERLVREIGLRLTQQQAQQEAKEQAEHTLRRVIGLQHSRRTGRSPLQACRTYAQQMLDSLKAAEAELPEEAKNLAKGEHAFAYLLQIVDRRDELDEDQLAQWQEAVSNGLDGFGQWLWNSALLGRLISPEETPPQPTPPSPLESISTSEETAGETPQPLQSDTLPPELAIEPEKVLDEADPCEPDSGAHAIQSTEAKLPEASLPESVEGIEGEATEPSSLVQPIGAEAAIEYRESEIIPISPSEEPEEATTGLGKPEGAEMAIPAPETTSPKLFPSPVQEAKPKTAGTGLSEKLAEQARDSIWQLIADGRLGVAYHLSRAIKTGAPHLQPQLPSWLLRALALSGHVRHDSGELAQTLLYDFGQFSQQCFSENDEEYNHALRFLLIAVCLRPSLLTPIAGATTILDQVYPEGGLDHLFEYCSAIIEFAKLRRPLNPSALQKFLGDDEWLQLVQSLQHEIREWRKLKAPKFDFDFGQAKDVWQWWRSQEGEKLHDLLDTIEKNDAKRLDLCHEIIKFFSDDNNIVALADQTNRLREVNGGNAKRIIGKAQRLLRKHSREAIIFGSRWAELQEARPGRRLDRVRQEALNLRDKLPSLQSKALRQLNDFERQWNSSPSVRSGIAACRQAIKNVETIFDQSRPLAVSEPDDMDLLHVDLLRIPTLMMNEDWEPEIEDQNEFVGDLHAFAAACACDWPTVFERRKEERDHEATFRIIEFLERNPDKFDGHLDRLHSMREKHIRDCLAALREDLEVTRQVIENAVWHGLLREQERVGHVTQIEEIEHNLDGTLRFGQRHKQLAAIRSAIDSQRKAECERLRQWLTKELSQPAAPVQENGRTAAIEEALERGDVWSADEYLSGQSPAQLVPMAGDLEDFFPDLLNRIVAFLRPSSGLPPWLTLVAQARAFEAEPTRGGSIGPIPLPESQTDKQSQLVAKVLETWRLAKDQRRLEHSAAEYILRALGFKAAQCTPLPEFHGLWHSVLTEQSNDRGDGSPVPYYGSGAKGRYRLFCVWNTSVDDLLKAAEDAAFNARVIVFYFGSLTEANRRLLARRCLELKRTLLVMDDALLLFLCSKTSRTSRLQAFFNCTLPFTFLNPYDSENSDVPPEMFYGREEEKRMILDPNGACFIYGGRRLGKTALLLTAQREFHNSEQGRIAIWLDLKSLLARNGTRLSSLWGELAYQLKESAKRDGQDFPEFNNLSRQTTANTLIAAIKEWLNTNPERRLLLLLDEADRFLDLDSRVERGEAFTYVTRLKDLMTSTERRVKVIFAGLHNVQRTTHLSNHPLTRLGSPVCAGPLLDNGAGRSEVQAAIDLIQRPLAALGYRFEQPQLIRRILWQTNYYPNLIQLYCHRLLELLTDRNRGLLVEGVFPPRIISARDLQAVYQSAQLRDDIRLRFRDTLDLDKRYLLIANAIAFESQHHSHSGLTVEEIRRLATDWWADGFKKSAEGENFRVLLDEMVGLGVLHKASTERYTLRSHNVALLIGTDNEIAETLLSSASWQEEEPYGATVFREAYGDSPARRSPLTAEQESVLREERNGVTVITGNEAGGLRELASYLKWSFGEDFFIGLDAVNEFREFEQELETLNARAFDGVTLVLVSPNCSWNEHWVEAAKRKLRRLRTHHSFVQIAFLADPLALWQLLDGGQLADADGVSRFPLLKLTPWHDLSLRHWLSDCNFPGDEVDCRRVSASTGKWPSLLMRLYDGWRAMPRIQNNLPTALQKIKQEVTLNERELGLAIHPPVKVLDLLSQWGETTRAEELAVIAEDLSEGIIRQSLIWADWLSLASPVGNGYWRLDSFVNSVLNARRQK